MVVLWEPRLRARSEIHRGRRNCEGANMVRRPSRKKDIPSGQDQMLKLHRLARDEGYRPGRNAPGQPRWEHRPSQRSRLMIRLGNLPNQGGTTLTLSRPVDKATAIPICAR